MSTFDQYADCVIAMRGRWQILGAREDFKWASGAQVGVYRVTSLGTSDCTFLRAVRGSDGLFRVFDLRDLSNEFARDWVRAERHERYAVVMFTLRTVFESPEAFTRWAEAKDPAPPVLTAPGQLPARRQHGSPQLRTA